MEITTNIENINEELLLIYNIFKDKLKDKQENRRIFVSTNASDNTIQVEIFDGDKVISKDKFQYKLDKNENISKYFKRFAKIALYRYLSKITGYNAPWGSLTGIRPTKLYYELLNKHKNKKIVKKILKQQFLLSNKKIKQLELIVEQQKEIHTNHKSIDFYINIPFCTSRCYYCSFISLPLIKCRQLVEPYVDALIKDIKKSLKYIELSGMTINTIYIGGGTPTSIGIDNLEKILNILPKNIRELTVEAGRPDTIDKDMLFMLNRHNVTRISINPQTFNNRTLELIGRNHTAEDLINVYNLARNYPFVVNMDLIAGLGDEKFKDFKYSLNKAISLKPDNITVHTLSIKRASTLKTNGGDVSNTNEVEKMVKYSVKKLYKYNYRPYYLYRQKNMLGNLENTGYCVDNKVCEFNINSMEETLSVIACGANAISKSINYENNHITRHANVKNIEEYINRIDEMIDKKIKMFENDNV